MCVRLYWIGPTNIFVVGCRFHVGPIFQNSSLVGLSLSLFVCISLNSTLVRVEFKPSYHPQSMLTSNVVVFGDDVSISI
jgi:hypothetical protein